MRTATTRPHVLLAILLATTCVVAQARAQNPPPTGVDPLWDHYKVYELVQPYVLPVPIPVNLTDQFGQYFHQVYVLDKFMNPVEKRVGMTANPQVFPIHDALLHYTWWQISPQPFAATVAATNQFGDQTLLVHDAVYLLNPALKNQTGTALPQKNHYKCYLCDGLPVNVPIIMIDQFDTWQATVQYPRFFCNPVKKQVGTASEGGPVYPIVDPNQHYICYDYQPIDPGTFGAIITDQFVNNLHVELYPSRFICVPTLKNNVTATTRNTWGKMKMLYR